MSAGECRSVQREGCPAPVAVSVVMATYRRPLLLRRCLEAMLRQTLASQVYEVIVVDDGRSEDTRAVVDELAARVGAPRLRYLLPEGTRGPAGARNRGWRASTAPVIAFTDDDTVPDADWLRQGLLGLGDHVAVCGRVIVPTAAVPTDHEKNTRGLETAEFVTANAFVRRAALEATGGFDERYTRAWREDSDLHFSLLRGGSVGSAPAAIVLHPVRAAPWGVSLAQQANVYFDALLYKKHPKLYLERIRSRPPWRYFVIVGCSVAALACAVAQAWPAAGMLAGVALAGIAGFAWQRLRGTKHTPSHIAEMLVTSAAIPFLAVYWRVAGAWRFKVLFP